MTSEGPDSDVSTAPPRARRRWLRRAFLGLLALLLVYPVAGNLLLNTGWGRKLILPRNDKIHIDWTGAWTVLPGLVHVSGLEIDNRTLRLRFDLSLDRSHIFINLPSLIARRLDVEYARGSGFECSFDLLEASGSEPKPPKEHPWTIDLQRIVLSDFRQCSTGAYRLIASSGDGSGSVAGGYRIRLRETMKVSDLALVLDGAELLRDDVSIARITHLDSRIDTDEFAPRQIRGRDLLSHTSGEIDFDTETNSLAFLNAFLSKAKWLHLTSGFGTLRSRLALDHGVVLPESRIHFRSQDLAVRYLDYVATGGAELIGQVEGKRPRFAAAFEKFQVRQASVEQPYILGRALMIRIEADDSDLAKIPHVDVQVDLPRSQVPDLTIYNDYLPPRAGIELTSGTGTIEAHLSLSTLEDRSEGSIELSSDDLSLSSGDLDMGGNLTMKATIENIDPERRGFESSSTTLSLDGVKLTREGETVQEDWKARLELSQGVMSLTRPLAGRARLDFSMTDSRPVLTFFAERRPKLETVARLVNVKDITGSAQLEMSSDALILDQLEIDGQHLHAEGRLCLGNPSREGALHLKAFGIGLGSYFVDKQQRWTVLRPRRWYEEKLQHVDCTDTGIAGKEPEVSLPEETPAGETGKEKTDKTKKKKKRDREGTEKRGTEIDEVKEQTGESPPRGLGRGMVDGSDG